MSYVSAVRCYLKKEEPEETEESPLFAQADNPGSTEIFISPSTGIQFVLIPAGEFEMGSSSEEKERSDSESPLPSTPLTAATSCSSPTACALSRQSAQTAAAKRILMVGVICK